MSQGKTLILSKPNKLLIRYKNLSDEFNQVSLGARYNLSQINLFLDKKSEIIKKINSKSINIYNSFTNENLKSNLWFNNGTIKPKRLNSFISPSDIALKNLKLYQRFSRNDILGKNGIKIYSQKLKSNYKKVQDIQKNLENISPVTHEIFRLSKRPAIKIPFPTNNQKKLINNVECKLLSNKIYRNFIKNCPIEERKNINNSKKKYNIVRKININKNHLNRAKSAMNIKNNFNSKYSRENENYKFFLDHPKSPITQDKTIQITPKGGGLIYRNSVWRIKSVNDLVRPYSSSNTLDKLEEMNSKRKEIISKIKFSKPFDSTFISNGKGLNINNFLFNNDFYCY